MVSREKSHWAWGYDDAFPDEASRGRLRARVENTLGVTLTDEAPVPLASVNLPPSRFAPPQELRAFGSDAPGDRVRHSYGRGYRDLVRAFRGEFASPPDWVFSPESEDQIASLLHFCEREDIQVVPFGGGTSVVGGVESVLEKGFRGVATLSLARLDKVLEVNTIDRTARIQAGARGPVIEEGLAPHGLTLRHYPQSFEFSTLGGWIATRAGGHFATLHTHIDDFVQSIRMLTPRGRLETRHVPASGAGPSADRLILGSEGAFGVIVEATLRLQEIPRWRASASVSFARFEDGVRATRALAQSGLHPSNCRLLDPVEALMHRVSDRGHAVLLLAFESADHPLEAWLERSLSIATDLGGSCEEDGRYTSSEATSPSGETAAWKAAFLSAPYLQSALVRLGVVVDTFETACTWSAFPELDRAIRADVGEALARECGGGVVSCRFTHVYPDGPAPYYTFLGAARRGDELAQWAAIKAAASGALARAGGTITHHHAVGRWHKAGYEAERSPLFGEALRAVKQKLDPRGILNPGVLV
jgi:alkyldihydroxyacetonephosphate synthase